MTRESIDELRERLLRDERVLDMIRMRAYEIYLIRGGTPGYDAEDWFRAEVEVIGFLIDQESRSAAGSDVAHESTVASAEPPPAEPGVEEGTKPKKGASTKTATSRKKKAAVEAQEGSNEGGEKKKTGKRASEGKSSEVAARTRKTKSS